MMDAAADRDMMVLACNDGSHLKPVLAQKIDRGPSGLVAISRPSVLSTDAEDAVLPREHFHETVMVSPTVGDSSLRIIIRAIASPITTVVK